MRKVYRRDFGSILGAFRRRRRTFNLILMPIEFLADKWVLDLNLLLLLRVKLKIKSDRERKRARKR